MACLTGAAFAGSSPRRSIAPYDWPMIDRSGAPPGFRRQVIELLVASVAAALLLLGGMWFLAVPVWIVALVWVTVSTRRSAQADADEGIDRSGWETKEYRWIGLAFLVSFVVGGVVVAFAAVMTALE